MWINQYTLGIQLDFLNLDQGSLGEVHCKQVGHGLIMESGDLGISPRYTPYSLGDLGQVA